ncbi:hypothetical protein FUAX_34070 [Fulvitalea axinellae]|uniref:Uncharacterized protein n=1 Tax=Fulvitalea axinellae TaxID=1182444 RepID=A0AAU9DIK9_9BACT|nr:hypothetical protein FUAX_34070 [Fulvitalea axinellae]
MQWNQAVTTVFRPYGNGVVFKTYYRNYQRTEIVIDLEQNMTDGLPSRPKTLYLLRLNIRPVQEIVPFRFSRRRIIFFLWF